jgi:hypothetical protein
MPFSVSSATFDMVAMQATVVAEDNPATGGPAKTLQITFPYQDPEATTARERLIAVAKQVLRQALNELA